jgi:4-aminobutyrate aminotransferase-like enzyme
MQKGGVAAILHPMHNVIRLQPPLTITREQLDKGLEVFEASVKKVEKQKL